MEVRLPVTCERCDGSGCEPGTAPVALRRVRRHRRGPRGRAARSWARSSLRRRARRAVPPAAASLALHGVPRRRAGAAQSAHRRRGAGRGRRRPAPPPSRPGPAAPAVALPGDLYVTVELPPDPAFERQGDDLLHVRKIAFTQRALGARLDVETLEGPEELIVRPGRSRATCSGCKGRACRRCGAAAVATCSARRRRGPVSGSHRRRRSCSASSPSCAASRSPPATAGFSTGCARPSSSARFAAR